MDALVSIILLPDIYNELPINEANLLYYVLNVTFKLNDTFLIFLTNANIDTSCSAEILCCNVLLVENEIFPE